MPSPTSSTWPVSRTSICLPKSLICLSRTDTISPADCLSAAIGATRHQVGAERVQAGADGRVVHPVADLHDQPAQQVRVGAGVQVRLGVELAGQGLLELAQLV